MRHRDNSSIEKFSKDLYIRIHAVAVPAGLETKPFVPVLLHLARQTLQPPALNNLIENREKNRQNRIMKAFIKPLRPQRVDGRTVGTSIAFHPDTLRQSLKVSLRITVTPKPASLTSWTPLRLWPTETFPFLDQPLYIYRKMKYQ
jgi:hypothetical protein